MKVAKTQIQSTAMQEIVTAQGSVLCTWSFETVHTFRSKCIVFVTFLGDIVDHNTSINTLVL